MKVFLLAALLAALYVPTRSQNTQNLSDEVKQKINDNVENCKSQHNIDSGTVDKFREGNWDSLGSNNNAKCFIKCYLEKGVVQNGQINEQYLGNIANIVGSDKMNNAKKKCKDKMQVTTCEEAYETFKCFHTYQATVL